MPFVARLPVNYAWVYVSVLALPILANLPALRREFPDLVQPARRPAVTLLGRTPGLRGIPLRTDHALVRHAQTGGQCRRTLHAPGGTREHRRQSRDDVRPRPNPLGGHADGRGFHFLDRLYAGRRNGRAAAQLRHPPHAARPAPRSAAPLRLAGPRVASGHTLRHHADGAAGYRLAPGGESASGALVGHDDRALALRRIRGAPFPIPRRDPRRHRAGHQIRRHRLSCACRGLRSGGGLARQEEDQRAVGARRRTPAAGGRSALRYRLGQDG